MTRSQRLSRIQDAFGDEPVVRTGRRQRPFRKPSTIEGTQMKVKQVASREILEQLHRSGVTRIHFDQTRAPMIKNKVDPVEPDEAKASCDQPGHGDDFVESSGREQTFGRTGDAPAIPESLHAEFPAADDLTADAEDRGLPAIRHNDGGHNRPL